MPQTEQSKLDIRDVASRATPAPQGEESETREKTLPPHVIECRFEYKGKGERKRFYHPRIANIETFKGRKLSLDDSVLVQIYPGKEPIPLSFSDYLAYLRVPYRNYEEEYASRGNRAHFFKQAHTATLEERYMRASELHEQYELSGKYRRSRKEDTMFVHIMNSAGVKAFLSSPVNDCFDGIDAVVALDGGTVLGVNRTCESNFEKMSRYRAIRENPIVVLPEHLEFGPVVRAVLHVGRLDPVQATSEIFKQYSKLLKETKKEGTLPPLMKVIPGRTKEEKQVFLLSQALYWLKKIQEGLNGYGVGLIAPVGSDEESERRLDIIEQHEDAVAAKIEELQTQIRSLKEMTGATYRGAGASLQNKRGSI